MTLTQISSRGVEDTLRWSLGASGTDHYTFTGPGLTGTVNDPTIYLSRGQTYIFENNSGGHPFQIQSVAGSGGSAYNTGVTNNGGGNGTEIKITVPHDAPDNLYYQCTSHANMGGTIFITGAVADGSITSLKIADATIVAGDLANDAVTSDKIADNPNFSGTQGIKLPIGTTAQRHNTEGSLRYNSETNLPEYYNGTSWIPIETPPTLASINNTNPTVAQIAAGLDLVLTGSFFATGATVKFIGNDGTVYTSPTVAIDSSVQITARVPTGVGTSNEPYDVRVTSAGGSQAVLENAMNVNSTPSWTTASGTIATIDDTDTGTHATLAATDPDGTITYSGTVGGGLSLNSSTGVISGNPTDVTTSTTLSFTATATDNDGAAVNRSFNIIVNPVLDGSTAAKAGTSAAAIKSASGTTTNGVYYIKPSGVSTAYQAYCNMNIGGGIILAAKINEESVSSNDSNSWRYYSNLWTTNNNLNSTALNTTAEHAKLQPAQDFPMSYFYVTNDDMTRWCRYDLDSTTTGFHNIWGGSVGFSVGNSVGTHQSEASVETDHQQYHDGDTGNFNQNAYNTLMTYDNEDWTKNMGMGNYSSFGSSSRARLGYGQFSDSGPWDTVHSIMRGLGTIAANFASPSSGSYNHRPASRFQMIFVA